MRRFGIALLALVLAPSSAFAAACIWFADTQSIKQVNTDDNTVVAEVALASPRRLVMNDNDCSVWALRNTNGRLRKFDPAGTEVRDVNVLALDPLLTEALRIRLDPFDNSLWVTGERRIVRLDADAAGLVAAFDAPAEIRRFRIGMDQKLWVLGKRKLWRFNRRGNMLEERPLDTALQGEARHFVVDELRDTIWVAGDTQVARMSSTTPEPPIVVAQISEGTAGFALDPITGRVWIGRPASIDGLNPDGTLFTRIDLGALGFTGLHKLRFDPASASLWAGFSQQLARFTDTGAPVAVFAAVDFDDEAVGVPPFKIRPRLVLERPPENGIVNTVLPLFELQYSARCNGRACDVPATYLSSLELSATLNAAEIGAGFQLDAATGKASFQSANPLAEGLSSFTARLTDRFGHKSNAIETAFTVDTVAPVFGAIEPAAGTALTTPQVTLRGSINEAQSTVTLNNAQALNPQGPNPQSPQPPDFTFSWGLTLLPGNNAIQLSAIDAAGNVATTTQNLALTGAPPVPPPQIVLQSPAAGAAVDDSQVIVTGTWSGPSNTGITVNGIIAAVSGNQFSATVPLVTGSNTLTVTATVADGRQVISTVQVTSSGPSPTRVTASVVQGLAPLQVSFTITSDRDIQSVDGSFAAGSPFSVSPLAGLLSFTYTSPGAHDAVFNVRHLDGTTVTRTVRIVVIDAQQLDNQLRGIWTDFTSALSRGDKVPAMQLFAANARPRFGPVLDALGPSLPAIVATFSPPLRASIGAGYSEYAVVRVVNGVKRVYFIQFVVGADGVWRIESM